MEGGMKNLIDRMDSFSDWFEQVIMDIIVGSLVVILTITAVHWVSDTQQERLDAAGRPPVERRR